ncbi:MAG: DinB family protein [Thermomicrobiales bacterium]
MSANSAIAYHAFALLDETFHTGYQGYLERNGSIFETLAGITAEEASRPVGGKCATLAAQVKHIAFYIDDRRQQLIGEGVEDADWNEIWETTSAVDADEWAQIIAALSTAYDAFITELRAVEDWSAGDALPLAHAMIVAAHSAYHLGEIRQALCTLR